MIPVRGTSFETHPPKLFRAINPYPVIQSERGAFVVSIKPWKNKGIATYFMYSGGPMNTALDGVTRTKGYFRLKSWFRLLLLCILTGIVSGLGALAFDH